MKTQTIREEIVDALQAGFVDSETTTEVYEDRTLVHVEGFDEPITVLIDDVLVPEEYGDLKAGIRLDVQTILAELED